MGRYIYCILGSLLSLICFAENYKIPNIEGDILVYSINNNKAYIEPSDEYSFFIKSDSLIIPDSIQVALQNYPVVGARAAAFSTMPAHTITLSLPATWTEWSNSIVSPYINNHFENYYVDSVNPLFRAKDGILYTKTCNTLVSYPTGRKDSIVFLREGIDTLYKSCLFAANIVYLELPLSLKHIGMNAMLDMNSLRQIILKDSIRSLDNMCIGGKNLSNVIIGKELVEIDANSIQYYNQPINLYLHALNPPKINGSPNANNYIVHVPLKSLSAYQQAEGWKEFGTILPIEPPIVTGLSSAEVSWVQNFSATGYIWTLYLDEAKTQRFMSMTFDAIGHLTNIDFGSNLAPKRAPALYNGEDEENRYAEYYSFTITGLSPDTKYYYTRQSLNGDEVIDEENGSFKTQNDEVTGLKNYETETSAPQKFIKNGQMFIIHDGKTYSVTGQEVK